jgi:RHS repeat-associated protein
VHDGGKPYVKKEVQIENNIVIIFNEEIDPDTTTYEVELEKNNIKIDGTLVRTGANEYKFFPSGGLVKDAQYMLRMSGFKDLLGNAMDDLEHSFVSTENNTLIFEYSILTENDESMYGNNSLLHGRTYEPEVGLYYFRNRYYHPKLGRFLQQDPNGYEDSLNAYQAFNQNPVNFTDPMGQEVDLIYFDSVVYDGNITKSMRRNLALTTEGTINTGLSFSQWFAHMLKSVVTIGYADQPWTYTTINFTNEGDFFQINQDTRSAGGKIVGIVTDPIKGVSDWAANNILSFDPNINPKYQEQFHENAVRQTPGAIVVLYTTGKGSRFAASKINSAIKSSPYFENTYALMDQAFEALNSQYKGKIKTWNEYQTVTTGQFSSRSDAAKGWELYRSQYGIVIETVRNSAAKRTFLKQLAESGKAPKWMNQWLKKGNVPPGYEVDHIVPLSIGGQDIPANMRLYLAKDHAFWHLIYHPWRR